MDESVWADLETRVGKLIVALKASQREIGQLKKQKETLLRETTRLHDETVRLRRVQGDALLKVRALQDRIQELENHVAS